MDIADIRGHGFKLGGSRRMMEKFPDKFAPNLTADWDFYGQDTQENRKWLEENGFIAVPAVSRGYWDDLLCDIYKNPLMPDIEILLRSDAAAYERAFESIPVDEYINRLWKSAPHIGVSNKPAFRAAVCAYFNVLFVQAGASPVRRATVDELPF